jgi:hypothetical protein
MAGNGSGSGGGRGTGTGGGTGSGSGTGVGPRVTSGDRRIVSSYSFQGDLDKATIYASIKVSPDGIGVFESFARGRPLRVLRTGWPYSISRNIKFNKSDHESVVTVQFIRLTGIGNIVRL